MIIFLISLLPIAVISIVFAAWFINLKNQIKNQKTKNTTLRAKNKARNEMSLIEEFKKSAREKDGEVEVDLVLSTQLGNYLGMLDAIGITPTPEQKEALDKILPNEPKTPTIESTLGM